MFKLDCEEPMSDLITRLSALLCLTACVAPPQAEDDAPPDATEVTDVALPQLPHALYDFIGEAGGDSAGESVSSAGDVDGDGLDDLLIGAPWSTEGGTDGGKAYVMLASSLGDKARIKLSRADYSLSGEGIYEYAGDTVSSAGDVDGDGLDDILVAATGSSEGGEISGKVYLFLGRSLAEESRLDPLAADYTFTGEGTAKDAAGGSVSSVGDVDGDGLDDILIGADGYNDGDAVNVGRAYLFLGRSLGATGRLSVADADVVFTGERQHKYAGNAVSGAGDVDGDGLADLMIAAPYNGDMEDWAGRVYVFLGKSLGATPALSVADADYVLDGAGLDDNAGCAVASAGDLDGDGRDDLLIGARWNDEGGVDAGVVYVVLGRSLGAEAWLGLEGADYRFVGEGAGDDVGHSVAGVGDVDGDGLDDLLLSSPWNDDGGSGAGKAYLFLGRSLGSESSLQVSAADYSFEGEESRAYAGYDIAGAGDVDGDGRADFLIGSTGHDRGGDGAGMVHLVLGGALDL